MPCLKLRVIFNDPVVCCLPVFRPTQTCAGQVLAGTASEDANQQPVPARKEFFAPPPRAEASCVLQTGMQDAATKLLDLNACLLRVSDGLSFGKIQKREIYSFWKHTKKLVICLISIYFDCIAADRAGRK